MFISWNNSCGVNCAILENYIVIVTVTVIVLGETLLCNRKVTWKLKVLHRTLGANKERLCV